MFERFTDRARRVLVEAQSESSEQRHGFLGTEHIVIGILRVGEGLAFDALVDHHVELEPLREKVEARLAEWIDPRRDVLSEEQVLASIGIDLASVRSTIEAAFGPGALPDRAANPPFTPKAKQALEGALTRALTLRHRYIGTEHELLGVLDQRDGVACRSLGDLGVDVAALTADVVRRAAPQQERVGRAWDAIADLQRAVNRLAADDRERVQPVLAQLGNLHGAAIRDEQAEVNRLADKTAQRLESALDDARRSLLALGVAI